MDHKTRNAREAKERELQFVERMLQGPRLLGVLLAALRGVR